MQVFADDLDVGALARQHLLGVLGDLLAVRVVLVEQVDLLDRPVWSFMKVVSASIFIEVSASRRKCQKLHLLLVRSGSTAA